MIVVRTDRDLESDPAGKIDAMMHRELLERVRRIKSPSAANISEYKQRHLLARAAPAAYTARRTARSGGLQMMFAKAARNENIPMQRSVAGAAVPENRVFSLVNHRFLERDRMGRVAVDKGANYTNRSSTNGGRAFCAPPFYVPLPPFSNPLGNDSRLNRVCFVAGDSRARFARDER